MSEFMFIRVCVWFIYKYIYSYIYISLSLYVCVYLSSLAESAQTDIIFTLLSELLLFFFFSFDVYLQAENQGLSYCMFTFHLFIVNTGKEEEEEEPE